MKMVARIVDAPACKGGKALLLFDDEGTILPGQLQTELQCAEGANPQLTVTFQIDGTGIRLE